MKRTITLLLAIPLTIAACTESDSAAPNVTSSGSDAATTIEVATSTEVTTTSEVATSTTERPATTVASTTTALPYDPVAASPQERFERYEELVVEYLGDPDLLIEEAPTVAANYCDNTVADMGFYLEALITIGTEAVQVVSGATALADAYCPSQRLVLEAAFTGLGIDIALPTPSP